MAYVSVPGEYIPRKVDAGRGWQWIKDAWTIVTKQLGMWILLYLVYIVINFLVQMVPYIGSFISALIAPVFSCSFLLIARKTEQGEEVELADLFAGLKQFSSVGAQLGLILVGLMMLLAIVVLVWVALSGISLYSAVQSLETHYNPLLLLLPMVLLVGVVLVSCTYWLACPLMVFNGLRPWQAMKTSFKATNANWPALLVCGAIMVLLLMLAIAPAFLGLLLFLPLKEVVVYTAWKDIFPPDQPAQQETYWLS